VPLSKPPALKRGDLIAITSPSFFVENEADYRVGVRALVERGYQVFEAPSTQLKFEHSTGTPQFRAEELMALFLDKAVRGIICSDGGARAIELLEYLDFEIIQRNPKLLSGFSDICHLHIPLLEKAQLPSILGFDIINGFGSPRKRERYEARFWELAEGGIPRYDLPGRAEVVTAGVASGTLVGGWLEPLVNLTGTPYLTFDGCDSLILLIETIDLQPSRILFMLNALKLARWFPKVNAVLFGSFTNCNEHEYHDCAPSLDLIIRRFGQSLRCPVVINMPFGHGDDLESFPIGIEARLDTHNRHITLLDSFSL